tara:strand:- start:252 stop:1031 length:780 start_codon:yes stop_codon:yes gene_type:complete
MITLTEKEILSNWEKLRGIITDTFEGERLEKLNTMYDYFEERMVLAPASGKEHFHYAMVGGYVAHVLHVVGFAVQLKDLWEKNGGKIDFTDEELIFAAMHHDLGKVGDLHNDYYVPQESDWHRKNKGEIYTHNGDLNYMTVTDRAVFLLGHFNIPMSELEYLGLRLTDGLYEQGNESYLKSYFPQNNLKSNIAYILHQADMMATHIEFDEWMKGNEKDKVKVKKSVEKIKKATETTSKFLKSDNDNAKDLFDELFGKKQ